MASYYKKYQRLQKYQEDKPVTPSEYKKGEMIETVKCNTKDDCQNDIRIYERIERVENAPYGEIECRDNGAYLPQYLSYSVDNGQSWIKTKEIVNYIKIMDNSEVDYCNNVDMVRYTLEKGQYACDSKGNLVYKYKKQIKKEDVWEDVIPLEYYDYDKCPHYEEDSWECNPPAYLAEKQIQKVVENPETTYECVDPNTETAVKWSMYREDETTDNGETWTEGTALTKYKKYEINSYDCGWIDTFKIKTFYIDYYAPEEEVGAYMTILNDEVPTVHEPSPKINLPFEPLYAYHLDSDTPTEISSSKKGIKITKTGVYRVYFIAYVQENVINEKILDLGKFWLQYLNVYSIDIDLREIFGNKLKLRFYDTSEKGGVVNAYYGFFSYCRYLTYVNPNFLQIFNEEENLKCTFANTYKLRTVDKDMFKNFNNCISISQLFFDSGINDVPEGLFDSFNNVIYAESTFAHCEGLSSIPDTLFYNMKSVKYIGGLFYHAVNLKTLPRYCFSDNKYIISTIQTGISEHWDAFEIEFRVTDKKYIYNVSCNGPFDIDTDGNKVPFCHRTVGTKGYQHVVITGNCGGCQ